MLVLCRNQVPVPRKDRKKYSIASIRALVFCYYHVKVTISYRDVFYHSLQRITAFTHLGVTKNSSLQIVSDRNRSRFQQNINCYILNSWKKLLHPLRNQMKWTWPKVSQQSWGCTRTSWKGWKRTGKSRGSIRKRWKRSTLCPKKRKKTKIDNEPEKIKTEPEKFYEPVAKSVNKASIKNPTPVQNPAPAALTSVKAMPLLSQSPKNAILTPPSATVITVRPRYIVPPLYRINRYKVALKYSRI